MYLPFLFILYSKFKCHANFTRKSRGKNCKTLRISARLAQTELRILDQCSLQKFDILTSLQLFVKPRVCSDPKRCASGVEIAEKLRKTSAKELQNFWNVGNADIPGSKKNLDEEEARECGDL